MKMAVMMLKEKKKRGGGEKSNNQICFFKGTVAICWREIIPVVKLVCARVGPEVYYCNLVKVCFTSPHAAVRLPSCV